MSVGRISWTSTGRAGSFCASPSANPGGLRKKDVRVLRLRALIAIAATTAFAAVPATALAASDEQPHAQSSETAATGGAEFGAAAPDAYPIVPGKVAVILEDGRAAAPAEAPDAVKQIIWAGNRIIGMPYRYGGGHAEGFEDTGYDCSGTISYALKGADLLERPLDSRSFFRWGRAGRGAWVTVYTASSHAYMTVAGIRLDTSAAGDPRGGKGPRWRVLRKSNKGYKTRRVVGL